MSTSTACRKLMLISVVMWLFGLLPAPSAMARVVISEIVRVSETTGLDSNNLKTVSVDCPAGLVVISGGVFLTGTDVNDGLAIGQSLPLDFPSQGWFAFAYETTAFADDWSLSVEAFCIDSGSITRTEMESATSSDDIKLASATCPSGTIALGGGARVIGPLLATEFAITGSSMTTLNDGTWQAQAREVVATGSDWSLATVVICGDLANSWEPTQFIVQSDANRITSRLDCPLDEWILSFGAESSNSVPMILKRTQRVDLSSVLASFESASPVTQDWIFGSAARCVEPALFADDFESGGVGGWSSSQP